MSVRHQIELWRDIQGVSVKTLPGHHGIPPRVIFTVSQQGYMTQTKCYLNMVKIPQVPANSKWAQVWLLRSALYKHPWWDDSKGAPAGTNTVSEKINPNLACALQTFPGSYSRFTSSNPNTQMLPRSNTGNRSPWSFLCRWPMPISKLRPPEQRRGMGILVALAFLRSKLFFWVHSEEKHHEHARYRPCSVCGHVLRSAPHHSTVCLNSL